METLNISEIIIGERRREDMGDIKGLADSIRQYGLLHPVVVDDAKNLVAGGRRLAACKLLGWQEIPATLIRELSETELRVIEIEENIKRKDLTQIELSRNMVKLAEIKKPEIIEDSDPRRESPDRFLAQGAKNLGGRPNKPDSQQAIADAIGIPRRTLVEARQHVAAVDKYPVLEEFPKKKAIQTAKELDKVPEDIKAKIIQQLQNTQEPKQETVDQKAFQRMERFKKRVDSMIEFFCLVSKQSPSDYFSGMSNVEKAMTHGFFAENKLSMIDDGIEWLKLFRNEFEKQLVGEKQQSLRRVK